MKPYNKLFIILLTLLAVTLILSACRGDDPTTETEAPTVTDTPTEQPTEAPTEAETPEPETVMGSNVSLWLGLGCLGLALILFLLLKFVL